MNNQLRIAILGEFRPVALSDYIPALRKKNIPQGAKGSAIINLVRARISRNMPTDVITLDSTTLEPIQCWGNDLIRLWVVRRREKNIVRDAFRQERQLIHEVLAKTKADICHANWTYEYGSAAVTQRLMPHIVTVRDHSWNILKWYGYKYLGLYVITQWVLRKAYFLTAVSPYIAEYVSKIIKSPVPVLPNPLSNLVKLSSREKQFTRKSDPIIVSVLEWSRLKNVKRALQTFRLVRRHIPEVIYWLIGSGLGEGEPAWIWAHKNGLERNVHFFGHFSYPKTLECISGADILFHPSLEESFGNPIAEAMALNVPVIAAQEAGGSRWLLDKGNCGYLISGKSVKAMAEVIRNVLASPAKKKNIVSSAKQRIKTVCDPDSILEKYDRIYREVLKYNI